MTFCTQCGSQLPEGAKFCVKCGTPVQGAAAVPAKVYSTIILRICLVIVAAWFMLCGPIRMQRTAWVLSFYYGVGWLAESVCAAVCAVLALRRSRRLAAKVLQTLSIIDLALAAALVVIMLAARVYPPVDSVEKLGPFIVMSVIMDCIRFITLLVFPIITLVWTFRKKT